MSLFKRCRHQWEEVGRTFTPPSRERVKVNGPSWEAAPIMERAVHGFTNIEQRCCLCGEIRVHEVLGNVASAEQERPA